MIKNGLMLPKGIQMDQTVDPSLASFYVLYDSGLSDDEKKEYIQLKQLSYVKTIKNCAVFFTALTIITLVLGLIILLVLLS